MDDDRQPHLSSRSARRNVRIREERGQALAEFALVLPILLAVVTGICELGIQFNRYLTLTDAVRTGARVASVSRTATSPSTAAATAVRNAATDLPNSTDPATLQVGVTPTPWTQGGSVTVTASYPATISIFGLAVWSGSLHSSTTTRVE